MGIFAGRTPKIRSAHGRSVAVLRKVRLGGIDQWIAIRGSDIHNPLLLHVHGGPGGSMDVGQLRKRHPGLEERFTVVTWNQRGAVKSFSPAIPPESMTVAQVLADMHELVQQLLAEFGQSKLFVMGHSVGTVFGLLFAQRYPELLHAYVGINQVIRRAEEERTSYRTALELARQAGNRKAVADLERIGLPEDGLYRQTADLLTQRTWLTKLGGVSVNPNAAMGWHMSNFLAAEMTLADLTRITRGMGFCMETLWPELTRIDFLGAVSEVKAPIYLVAGKHDGITSPVLAAQFLGQVAAPHKELVLFEHSAHLAFVEEPAKFDELLLDRVLRHAASCESARVAG